MYTVHHFPWADFNLPISATFFYANLCGAPSSLWRSPSCWRVSSKKRRMPGVARSGRRCLGGLGFLRHGLTMHQCRLVSFFQWVMQKTWNRYGLKMAEVPKWFNTCFMVRQGGSGPATVAASVGSTGKIGWRRPGVTRDGCPRSLIFHGSPLPFSFACFQNISLAAHVFARQRFWKSQ